MENETVKFSPTSDSLRYVVYNGRVYWETGVTVDDISYFEKLKGENIGKTHYIDVNSANEIESIDSM